MRQGAANQTGQQPEIRLGSVYPVSELPCFVVRTQDAQRLGLIALNGGFGETAHQDEARPRGTIFENLTWRDRHELGAACGDVDAFGSIHMRVVNHLPGL
jgi:hypothetical protein